MRWVALLVMLMLSACSAETGPAGQASPASSNPITGTRGSG